ncbi:hypothetical protein [Leeuwenhoekiella sp. NPDC079379]|uniref:hypothetical protein n=1 Tax=Leeuwenhoekiella sp. NPDC079379 TaxID=3364122 RepID=UPI0037CB12B1
MENPNQKPNQQLTVQDNQKLSQILEASKKNEHQFFKSISEQERISNLSDALQGVGMGTIFTNHALLSGYKGKIPELNKQDIGVMVRTRFRTLSLEELAYAFQIDRHGYHGEPTRHYQLFNAEYVSTIINKYLEWKEKMKRIPSRNIPISELK